MFGGGEAVNTAFFHDKVRFEINDVVPRLVLWEAMGSRF